MKEIEMHTHIKHIQWEPALCEYEFGFRRNKHCLKSGWHLGIIY
jgi:hypothetical protein